MRELEPIHDRDPFDGRSRRAKSLKAYRWRLAIQLGGNPTAMQSLKLDLAAHMHLRITEMVAEGDDFGAVTAEVEKLAKILRDLGLEGSESRAVEVAA